MVASLDRQLSVTEFIARYGDDSRYELVDGELIDMEPTGIHERVAAFVSRKLNATIDRLDLPYFIPHRCLLNPPDSANAFRPDIIVLDETELENEPFWKREPVIVNGKTVRAIVEVVSTNWQNDYARKYEEYETLGIQEYWIVDYLGIGGRRYIGNPKQPTVTVCRLRNGMYESILPRSGDRIESEQFPGLMLECDRICSLG